MRRVIAIAIAGASLGGCSSMPSFSVGDYFKSTPPAIQVQLESAPPGADAKTSLGPGCKTPCSVSVPAPDTGFTVTYLLPRYEPATVQVNVIRNPGDFANPATILTDPNPVFVELRPAGPLPRSHKGMKPKTLKKKPKATGAPGESPFPDPNAPPPPGTAAPSR
jgi:hypothetical protein